MSTLVFDAFVKKITNAIDAKFIGQYDYNDLKNEYQTILREYNKRKNSPVEVMRILGNFKIELQYLKNTLGADTSADNKPNNFTLIIDQLIEMTILEYTLLSLSLEHESLDYFTEQESEEDQIYKKQSPYKWTANSSDLIEVLRGLLDMKSINDGDAQYAEFILFMGDVLNINLKNHKNLYNNISNRSGREEYDFSRITYLRKMVEKLEHNLELLDRKNNKKK